MAVAGFVEKSTLALRDRIRDTYKRAIEGELIALAVAPVNRDRVSAAGHSRSRSAGSHSKSGHSFSKGAQIAGRSVSVDIDEQVYRRFVEQLTVSEET